MDRDRAKETGQQKQTQKMIGHILMDAGLINREQLKQALQKQSVTGKRIGSILVENGLVSEENMMGALSRQLGFPSVDIRKTVISDELLKIFPADFLMKYQIVPIEKSENTLRIAMTNPLDRSTINDVEFMTGNSIEPMIASSSGIEGFLKKKIGGGEDIYGIRETHSPDRVEVLEEDAALPDTLKLKSMAESPAVIRMVGKILSEAIRTGAGSIHIKPRQNDALIRFRIDGLLRNMNTVQADTYPAIIARLKLTARMEISVCKRPQSGNVTLKIGSHVADLRLSTVPTVYGEKMVIRIMEKIQKLRNLESLGMHPKDLSLYYSLLSRPHGIVLIAGPVGSGTSTTLYTTLRYLRSDENNIMTVEDPVEYHVPGINQMQINPRENITFVSGLRAALHQDPDIIMISELRDSETAHLIFQSSLRGHMVLSALYCGQAVSALTHLVSFGITPHMAASAIGGIVAQRLVRRNCAHCLERYVPEPRILASLNIDVMEVSKMHFYHGRGCEKCGETGYAGQIGIFEILNVDHSLKELILSQASEGEIFMQARKKGMTTMEENGLYLALNKITTLDEIVRVVPPDLIGTPRKEGWEKQIISAFDDALYIL
ncbi:MAG: GspE/PulE family protein [Desulfococcaceae bacterium]